MRKLIIIFLLPCISYGQVKLHRFAKMDEKRMEQRNQCLHRNIYSPKQRLAFYPFNRAANIKLISFPDTCVIFTPLAVNHFAVDYSKVIEIQTLSTAAVDSLTDIMYNVGYTPIKLDVYIENVGGMCIFQPRNAVLFMDAKGNVTHYIEFCFHCHQYFLSSRTIKNTVYCEQKFDLLQKFFFERGVKYSARFNSHD